MKFQLALTVSVVLLAGCGGMSGLDADNKFSCKAPPGVTCMSVSGIYANAKVNNLPGLKDAKQDKAQDKTQDKAQDPPGATAATSAPNRSVQRNYNTPGVSGTTGPALPSYPGNTSPKVMSAPNSGPALRTAARILRVWVAPFEDKDGDLHDQGYFYVTVSTGSWTIEANRANIRSRFQQVYPLSRDNPANKTTEANVQTPQQAAAQTLPVSPVP